MAYLNAGRRIAVLFLHSIRQAGGTGGPGQDIFTQVTG